MFSVLLGRCVMTSGWSESAKRITYVSDMNFRNLLAVSICSSFNEKWFKRACHLFLLGQQTRLNLMVLWGNPKNYSFVMLYTTSMICLPSASASSMVDASEYTRMIGSVFDLRK